ncbi:MAG: thioredoxin family protein [Fuerstia sp.]|nr:thioredoxin family protein [Fuerstiella sp.]
MSANFNRRLTVVVLAVAMFACSSGIAAQIPWSTDIEDALHRATENGQPVLMEFTADWCGYCKKMEKTTFTDPDVAQRISQNFVAVRVDADQNKDLVKDLGIKGLPAILIVSPDLKVIERISGFQTPEALIPKLDAVTASRPSQGKPAKTVATQNPTQRRSLPSPQPELIEPEVAKPSPPARKELEFEAITQDEAPRVGRRPPVDPAKNPFVDAPAVRHAEPAEAPVADTDPESFFKTISREQEPRESEPEDTKQPEPKAGPAFDGLCIVSAVDGRELVKGTNRNQIKYRGQTLYFSSIENKEQFLASPATYWPMLDGACAMTLLEEEKRVKGSLEFAAVFRKRIWLFASQEAMQEFLQNPADMAEEASELAAELQR